ncbi:MAG: hypothetical protein ACNS62_08960 [Candidatus Cyclobacteriaceae bacterium M3_2C_046]
MKGTILDYNYKTRSGYIFAEDNIRYPFFEEELDAIIPVFTSVRFELQKNKAVNIKPCPIQTRQPGIKQPIFSRIRSMLLL